MAQRHGHADFPRRGIDRPSSEPRHRSSSPTRGLGIQRELRLPHKHWAGTRVSSGQLAKTFSLDLLEPDSLIGSRSHHTHTGVKLAQLKKGKCMYACAPGVALYFTRRPRFVRFQQLACCT